ncbi:hypothetical protein ACVWZV_003523 [Bradyrhizobium sp. GM5.1]
MRPRSTLAGGDDLLHHFARHVDGNGKADTDIAASGRDDGRIDADQFALQADQRAAGIAGIDSGVGLNEVFITLFAEAGSA